MEFVVGYYGGIWELYVMTDNIRKSIATFRSRYSAKLFLIAWADQTGMSNKMLHKYLNLIDM